MNKVNSILLVDDDSITNFLNKRLLGKVITAAEIHTALNGYEAVQLIENCAVAGKKCPEFILLDINMPVMDGFEFLKWFEQNSFPGKEEVEIVVLTTSSNPLDMERLKESQIKGVVNKPLTEEKILPFLEN